jgi:hypothetical protein
VSSVSDNRPPRYIDGDKIVYRASSLGMCERALVACANGYAKRDHPEWFQKVLDEGTDNEDAIRMLFHRQQDELRLVDGNWIDQYEGELEVVGNVVVRYHTDDVNLHPGYSGDNDDGSRQPTAILREYKKFRDSTWPNFLTKGIEVNQNYPWQVAAMMWSLRDMGYDVVCQFVGGHFDGERIIEVEHKLLLDPPIPRVAIIKKLARVERLIAEGLVPDEVPCQLSYPCGWWYLHDEKPPEVEIEMAAGEQFNTFMDWCRHSEVVKTAKSMLDTAEKAKKFAAEQLAQWVPEGAVAVGEGIRGEKVRIKRYQQHVPARTQEVKAHTRDYFKVVNERKDKD